MQPIHFVDITHWKDEMPDSNFRDVFADEHVAHCDRMAKELAEPVRDDPFLLGYSMTDCPLFTEEDCRERPDTVSGGRRAARIGWPRRLRNLGGGAAGKRAYVDTMREIYRDSIGEFNATYNTDFDSFASNYLSAIFAMNQTRLSAIAALLLIAVAPCCRLEAKAPNILFCMADDWGWPHAGAYGDQVIKTPTFDRLAKEGILFERAFVSSPSCTPCRNSILTGQQFYRLESGANLWSTLDVRYSNFMFLLRDAGYEIGHWRKAWGPGSFKPGGYTQDPCGPASTFDEFMQQRDKGKPFCFWFGTSDPHRSYVKDSGAKSGIPVDKVQVPAFYPDIAEIRSDIADYYFEVQRWDRDAGKAIERLEAANELDNTIIVMTGDHGMPFPRCKANLYDWGTRVPLAIRWGQQVKLPRTVDKLVSLTDLAPTFLAVAGAEIPEDMTGNSLLPILKNQPEGHSNEQRAFVVFGRERHVPAQQKPSMQGYPARAIRTDQWMLKLNLEPERWPAGAPSGATHLLRNFAECDDGPTKTVLMGMKDGSQNKKYYQLSFGKRPAVELYDCKQDRDQINNLADEPEHAGTVEKLRAQLIDYLRNTKDPHFTDKPVKFETYRYYGRL